MYYVEINLINGYSDSITDSVKLEKILLIAGRIVADFPNFFLLGNLFSLKQDGETLYSRRKIPRLKTMFEIDQHILSIIFFTCYKYKDARNILLNDFFYIVNLKIVNTNVLLWGDGAIIK